MWLPSSLLGAAALAAVVAGGVLVLTALALFGPGIDSHNPRASRPLTAFEEHFLSEHVARGVEETGFLSRPRPRRQVARVFFRFWLPRHLDAPAGAKGVVVVLHGMNSHSARNNTFMVELLRAGFIIAGLDHEGMGRSDGRHGYFTSVQHLADDAIAFVEHVKEKYKGHKVFLHGGYGRVCVVLVLGRKARTPTAAS